MPMRYLHFVEEAVKVGITAEFLEFLIFCLNRLS